MRQDNAERLRKSQGHSLQADAGILSIVIAAKSTVHLLHYLRASAERLLSQEQQLEDDSHSMDDKKIATATIFGESHEDDFAIFLARQIAHFRHFWRTPFAVSHKRRPKHSFCDAASSALLPLVSHLLLNFTFHGLFLLRVVMTYRATATNAMRLPARLLWL